MVTESEQQGPAAERAHLADMPPVDAGPSTGSRDIAEDAELVDVGARTQSVGMADAVRAAHSAGPLLDVDSSSDVRSPADAAPDSAPAVDDSASEPTTAAEEPDESEPSPAVLARDLRLTGSRGPVYGPVDLEITPGALTLVQGPQGAGRSSLLLTIAGRMRPDRSSTLTVLGESLPRRRSAIQRRTAVAGFDGIDDLDDSVTVGDLTRERLRWLAPWYRHVGRVSQREFSALAAPVFGERPLPRVSSVVWDLDEVDRMLLRITLAMAQRPELLVVDDVDQVHDTERRRTVWARLESLAADGLTVIASVASLDEAARVPWSTPPQLVTLATGPHALPA